MVKSCSIAQILKNTSDAEAESSKGYTSNKATTDSSTVHGGLLFVEFQSFIRPGISKEEFSKRLDWMHQNENLIAILNILQDCEVPDEVLHQQLFKELKHATYVSDSTASLQTLWVLA